MVEEIVEHSITVWRNDQFHINDVAAFDYIILSPGPGVPEEAGLLKSVIDTYGSQKKILGVCLGLQAIGEVYGADLKNLTKVWHGMKTAMQKTDAESLVLNGIDDKFYAGRYHSWVIDPKSDTSQLNITAIDHEGEIMAAEHKEYTVYGVQFHPESIMTPQGKKMLENFLNS